MRTAIPVSVMFISLIGFAVGSHAENAQQIPGLAADRCAATPAQTEGPYYPPKAQIDAQLDNDNDLTQIKGETGKAKGQLLYVLGQIRDFRCRPVKGAVVEIWQATEGGRYSHPRDTRNPAPLDPHFQYWGKYVTDQDGRYVFKTIKPGAYSIGRGTMRPSHIHFKVSHPEYQELITQLYFVGDRFQDTDPILTDVPSQDRNSLIVTMEEPGPDYERDARIARFNVTLPSGKG